MNTIIRHFMTILSSAAFVCVSGANAHQPEQAPDPQVRHQQPDNERLVRLIATEVERSELRADALARAKQMLADGAPPREVIQMLRDNDVQLPLDRLRERMGDDRPMRDPTQGQPFPDRPGERPDRGQGDGPNRPDDIVWNDDVRDAFMKEHFSEWYARLGDMKTESPEFADRFLRRMDGKVRQLHATLVHDPEMGTLDIAEHKVGLSILSMAGRVRRAIATSEGTPDLEPFKTELRTLLGTAFDVRTNRNKLNITRQQGRIAEMRQELDHLLEDREQIIDRQVEAVISETGRRRGRDGESAPFDPGMFGGPPREGEHPGEPRRDRDQQRERGNDRPQRRPNDQPPPG